MIGVRLPGRARASAVVAEAPDNHLVIWWVMLEGEVPVRRNPSMMSLPRASLVEEDIAAAAADGGVAEEESLVHHHVAEYHHMEDHLDVADVVADVGADDVVVCDDYVRVRRELGDPVTMTRQHSALIPNT